MLQIPRTGNNPCEICDHGEKIAVFKCILDENMESMISQVYHEQKKESRKGDFFNMVSKDDITMTDFEIRNLKKKKNGKDFVRIKQRIKPF